MINCVKKGYTGDKSKNPDIGIIKISKREKLQNGNNKEIVGENAQLKESFEFQMERTQQESGKISVQTPILELKAGSFLHSEKTTNKLNK